MVSVSFAVLCYHHKQRQRQWVVLLRNRFKGEGTFCKVIKRDVLFLKILIPQRLNSMFIDGAGSSSGSNIIGIKESNSIIMLHLTLVEPQPIHSLLRPDVWLMAVSCDVPETRTRTAEAERDGCDGKWRKGWILQHENLNELIFIGQFFVYNFPFRRRLLEVGAAIFSKTQISQLLFEKD